MAEGMEVNMMEVERQLKTVDYDSTWDNFATWKTMNDNTKWTSFLRCNGLGYTKCPKLRGRKPCTMFRTFHCLDKDENGALGWEEYRVLHIPRCRNKEDNCWAKTPLTQFKKISKSDESITAEDWKAAYHLEDEFIS